MQYFTYRTFTYSLRRVMCEIYTRTTYRKGPWWICSCTVHDINLYGVYHFVLGYTTV